MNRIDALIADLKNLKFGFAKDEERAIVRNDDDASEKARHNQDQCQEAIKAIKSIITETY